jgi:hypothetical protein
VHGRRRSALTYLALHQTKKKRGRPKTGRPRRNEPALVRFAPEPLAAIDQWSGAQDDEPSRPEAVRRLVQLGLAASLVGASLFPGWLVRGDACIQGVGRAADAAYRLAKSFAAAKLADLDRRLATSDGKVSGAAQRGRANTAASIMSGQDKARTAFVAERGRAARALADLEGARGSMRVRGRSPRARRCHCAMRPN